MGKTTGKKEGYCNGQNVCRHCPRYARLSAARISTLPRKSQVAYVLSFAFRREFNIARHTRLYASDGRGKKDASRRLRKQVGLGTGIPGKSRQQFRDCGTKGRPTP